eukprot:TRINITY_DN81391_c0_g1_i1.p1 TRINITY_DN81391_c0_g1~~TRINITY_DN81391_c0_g1_i1.p1  ORF type:complete len:316 (+),score=63.39 TRINITY_DN81391_c0_g1_i1:21-968(+)
MAPLSADSDAESDETSIRAQPIPEEVEVCVQDGAAVEPWVSPEAVREFSRDVWEPMEQAYGIWPMLQCRMLTCMDLPKPAEVAHLKFLSTSPPAANGSSSSEPAKPRRGAKSDPPSKVVPEIGSPGSWWRVGGEAMPVCQDLAPSSQRLRSLEVGDRVQQAGPARCLTSGEEIGMLRIPVLPLGWVTADKRSSSGSTAFLELVAAPCWRATWSSGSGLPFGNVLVRRAADLQSKEVALLRKGDIVEQTGPEEWIGKLRRMPIKKKPCETAPGRSSNAAGICGWVTLDASKAGGEVFFEEVHDKPPEPESPAFMYQ